MSPWERQTLTFGEAKSRLQALNAKPLDELTSADLDNIFALTDLVTRFENEARVRAARGLYRG